jgi:1-acyl-sn-glycerol-3-phosphate acyltransferase
MPRHYSKAELFIRSFIYVSLSSVTLLIYSAFAVLCCVLPIRWRHAVVRFYLIGNLKALSWICHINYVVDGLDNIPRDRVGIVMSKHQSTWETFYLPIIFQAPAIIAKRELTWIPFFGWALALAEPIIINRQKKTSAMQQLISKGSKYLAEKRWIMIFPEGTRTAYGVEGNYRPGGARLAEATGAFIIPVAHNAGKFWPRRKFIKQPGTIHVKIGPPIEPAGKTADELMLETKNWIETAVKEIDAY